MEITINTCRFCKRSNFETSKYELIKYGARHYAHPDCGLRAKGVAFFDSLPRWQLEQFPFFAAKDTGFLYDLMKRVAKAKD